MCPYDIKALKLKLFFLKTTEQQCTYGMFFLYFFIGAKPRIIQKLLKG